MAEETRIARKSLSERIFGEYANPLQMLPIIGFGLAYYDTIKGKPSLLNSNIPDELGSFYPLYQGASLILSAGLIAESIVGNL
ncbi:MAG TPA: hypothetical protein VJH92_04385 [Candidatus Nanoarchaeia archaeon]|nr:hypothetical protein [Candidatus Nanoarchaeia archaeon]